MSDPGFQHPRTNPAMWLAARLLLTVGALMACLGGLGGAIWGGFVGCSVVFGLAREEDFWKTLIVAAVTFLASPLVFFAGYALRAREKKGSS